MVWSWIVIGDCDQSNNSNPNAVITVVRAVVAAVMGCLFGCFKIKDVTVPNAPCTDSQSNIVSQSTPTKVISCFNLLYFKCVFIVILFGC